MTGTRVLCITAADRTAAYADADALLILVRAGEIVKGEGETAMLALGLDWDDMRAARQRADMRAARQRADRALKGLDHPITPAAAPTPAPGRPSAPPLPSTTPSVVPQRYHPHASRKRPTRDGDLSCSAPATKTGPAPGCRRTASPSGSRRAGRPPGPVAPGARTAPAPTSELATSRYPRSTTRTASGQRGSIRPPTP
jgi:hypothetical protein